MDRPQFPEVVDSTFIAAAKACETKAMLMYMHHWKPEGESVHLHAGAAFARGLEVTRRSYWEKDFDAEQSLGHGLLALIKAYGDFQAPENGSGSAKTLERMCGAFEFYFSQFPLSRDQMGMCDGEPVVMGDRRAIEFSFAHPLRILHPETGNPLIFSGRTDMIATFAEGRYLWDDKTASQLGESWSQQWDLRGQFSGYCWAARQEGNPVNGVVVNGVSILKTKYGQARAITNRADWELDRWEKETYRVLRRLIESWEANDYGFNLDDACSAYGGCAFRQVCKSPEPETWLPMYFQRRIWDPLTRTETLMEELNEA